MKMEKIQVFAATVVLLLFVVVSGCARKTAVPKDAELIWQGIVDSSDEWKNLYPKSEGILYLVEAKSGDVKEVQTVWKEKPNFSFTIDTSEEYQLFFKSVALQTESQKKSG